MKSPNYDIVVIGGGINGSGIALDAAGRGLKVCLCEMNDLASATSSRSSKLVHGGLRYLENAEFKLVHESLKEREILLHKAPHIVKPMRFRLPHQPHLRPAWMIRLGLFLYDTLARRQTLPGAKTLKFDHNSPLKPHITKGFEYSDAWVNDARLVTLNAVAAHEAGANILTYTRCISARRQGKQWQIKLQHRDHKIEEITSRCLINAAGPWAASLFGDVISQPSPKQLQLVQGSHIVVPRLAPGEEAYILQNADGRIVFVIPYLADYSMIGTTDVMYEGDPADVKITAAEITYLLEVVNEHFKRRLSQQDIITSFSGVRPLVAEPAEKSHALSKVSRDYALVLDADAEQAPLLSVFGGKLTTYRHLAEVAVNKVLPYLPPAGSDWTATSILPGGDFSSREVLFTDLNKRWPWLPPTLLRRWVKTYGTRCSGIISDCHAVDDLGSHFGHGLYQREVDYLISTEWARTADDILWRRTELGWVMTKEEIKQLSDYLMTR